MKFICTILFVLILQLHPSNGQSKNEKIDLFAVKCDDLNSEYKTLLTELKNKLPLDEGCFFVFNGIFANDTTFVFAISSGDKILQGHTIWGVLPLNGDLICFSGMHPPGLRKTKRHYLLPIYSSKGEIIEIIDETVLYVRLRHGKFQILQ